jgi:hypothetical protein
MSAILESNGLARGRFVDRGLATEAVSMALPLLEAAMRHPEYGDSGFLHIVVMDPAATAAETAFEDAILYEHSIGDRSRWDADYAGFARAKARMSWRFQEDSAVIQKLRAHALREDDTLLWGSVALDGIVVGVSGAFPWFDEAYSGVVAMCVRALAKQRTGQAATG